VSRTASLFSSDWDRDSQLFYDKVFEVWVASWHQSNTKTLWWLTWVKRKFVIIRMFVTLMLKNYCRTWFLAFSLAPSNSVFWFSNNYDLDIAALLKVFLKVLLKVAFPQILQFQFLSNLKKYKKWISSLLVARVVLALEKEKNDTCSWRYDQRLLGPPLKSLKI
jgi:hypothetical protein